MSIVSRMVVLTVVTLLPGIASGQTAGTLVVDARERSLDVPVEMAAGAVRPGDPVLKHRGDQ